MKNNQSKKKRKQQTFHFHFYFELNFEKEMRFLIFLIFFSLSYESQIISTINQSINN